MKSPTVLFGKQLFSPRSKKAKSSTALNVRRCGFQRVFSPSWVPIGLFGLRFSSDSVFNSQTLVTERSASIGRRLSKDASTFLSSSPPDINSRRSSYLDIISTGSKLSGIKVFISLTTTATVECSSQSTHSNSSITELTGSKS